LSRYPEVATNEELQSELGSGDVLSVGIGVYHTRMLGVRNKVNEIGDGEFVVENDPGVGYRLVQR